MGSIQTAPNSPQMQAQLPDERGRAKSWVPPFAWEGTAQYVAISSVGGALGYALMSILSLQIGGAVLSFLIAVQSFIIFTLINKLHKTRALMQMYRLMSRTRVGQETPGVGTAGQTSTTMPGYLLGTSIQGLGPNQLQKIAQQLNVHPATVNQLYQQSHAQAQCNLTKAQIAMYGANHPSSNAGP